MQAWYAVQSKVRQESVAAENLTRQQYDVYLPLIQSPKRRRGRWRDVIEPLFPSYFFVQLDLQRQNTSPIRSTRGVTGLVRFGNEAPQPVPNGLIERLKATETDSDGIIRPQPVFEPGDRVEIASGPLTGLQAVFLSSSGEERANLLLELLGRSNRVVLSRHHLVPAS